jgi:hypothetical protein
MGAWGDSLSDIGGFRSNLIQPSLKVNLGENATKSDGEYVLSTTAQKLWGFGLTQNKVPVVRSEQAELQNRRQG